MSREFIDRAVRYPAAPNPDDATRQTIEIMAGLVRRSASDPLLMRAAETALSQYAHGGPIWAMRGIDPFQGDLQLRTRACCEAVWWYCKHQIKFVHHERQIDVFLGERNQLQLLIEPSVLLRFGTPYGPKRMEGDCAIFSTLIPAMLDQFSIPWELVTVAWNPERPDIFLHVYPRAVLPNGQRLALDASHGNEPGWSIPGNRRFRTAVWGMDGSEVPDVGEARFTGLHGYQVRGFGDLIADATVPTSVSTDTSILPGDYSGDYANLVSSAAAGGYDVSTGPNLVPYANGASAAVAPPQSSSQWANFAGQLLKSGMTLAEINAIQPGTVVSANGAILRQATGLPVPVGGSSITGAFGSISPSYLMFGGLALLGVFALSAMKR